jgi:PPOX class probable F420-dependent enzyme
VILPADRARDLFAGSRVARLATADAAGVPHLVPIVFALHAGGRGDVLYSAVDAKPKRTTALRRLANAAANPAVAVLADHYAEDWTALWWARADGRARVLARAAADAADAADAATAADAPDAAEVRLALTLLAERYPQYRTAPPPGPVLAVDVTRWSGWAASSGPGD